MKKTLLIFLFAISGPFAFAQTLDFVNKANMPTARGAFSNASYNGFEYICNGFAPGQAYTSQIEKYSVQADSWSTLTTSPATIAKRYGNAAIFSDILYLFNGRTASGLNDKFEVVELSTGNVSVLPVTNPNPVSNAGSATYGDYILMFGGCVSEWTSTYSDKFYKITPWGEWTALADMPVALETRGTVIYQDNDVKLYVFGGYNQTDGLHENFETVATTGTLALTNWINVAETGTKLFEGKLFGGNKYAQMTAFNGAATEASNKTWLISPAIPFNNTYEAFLSFDTKDGYDNGATLEAYIITNWTGDITTSDKVLLNATISQGHTAGYATDFTNSGAISLAGINAGGFRIAFKYTGGSTPLATTTYQIDNVKVYAEYKSRNVYVYDFNSNTWTTQFDALPQDVSAHSVAVGDIFEPSAKIYVNGDYQNQTFLGAYNTGDGTFSTLNQTNMIGRRHHGSDILNNKLYLFGGNTTPQISTSLNSTQSASLNVLANTSYEKQSAVSFYPNPATDKINFNLDIESVSLFTFEGKKINVDLQNNTLDLSGLNNGVYLIQGTKRNGSSFSDKLIKN